MINLMAAVGFDYVVQNIQVMIQILIFLLWFTDNHPSLQANPINHSSHESIDVYIILALHEFCMKCTRQMNISASVSFFSCNVGSFPNDYSPLCEMNTCIITGCYISSLYLQASCLSQLGVFITHLSDRCLVM